MATSYNRVMWSLGCYRKHRTQKEIDEWRSKQIYSDHLNQKMNGE